MNVKLLCLAVASAALVACVEDGTPVDQPPTFTAAAAPAIGKSDSSDAADHGCRIALRSTTRLQDEAGEWLTHCADSACNWVWAGTLEADAAAVALGAVPTVLYQRVGSDTWWELQTEPVGPGGAGLVRYAFRMDANLFDAQDAAADPDLAVELVPVLRQADGSRLFDHNRNPGDFDNYRLDSGTGWSLGDDPFVCSRRPQTAAAVFGQDWSEVVQGTLRGGEQLAVHFDLGRLPNCRNTHNGSPAWDTTAFVQFTPGGEVLSQSVRAFVSDQGRPTNTVYAVPFLVTVPADAEEVAVWFRNASGAGSTCEEWDSDFGANYRFPVAPPRGQDPCADTDRWRDKYANDAYCPDYTVVAEADAGCELWVEGFADGYEGHYGIPFRWLEGWLRQGAVDGEVRGAGLYLAYTDASDASQGEHWAFGNAIEAGLYHVGFPYLHTGYMGDGSYRYAIDQLAAFVDVQRPTGDVVRLWQSRQGQNYRWSDAFGASTTTSSIPYGRLVYAGDDAGIFDARDRCR